jgi:hypothetical protein
MDLLKLVAFDEEDLAVLSAHLQDAALRVEDLAFLPKERRSALCARRFAWESDPAEPPRRRLTGIHFDRVQNARCRNMDPRRKDEVLNLLAVTFEPTTAPSGAVTLIFSEDRAIRLEVECIEAQMKDMGPVWEVDSRPDHPAPMIIDQAPAGSQGKA